MFDFLNRLFDWLFQFIPQFEVLEPNEKAVRVTCLPFGLNWHKVKCYGWYVWFPLIQTWTTLNVKPQILVVNVSRDDDKKRGVESSWSVIYWVQDVYKTIYESENHEERIACEVASVIGCCIEQGRPVESEDVIKQVRPCIQGFGVYIQKILKMDFVHVKSVKLYHDDAGTKMGRVYEQGE